MNSLVVKIQAKGLGLAPFQETKAVAQDEDEATSLVLTDLSKFNSVMQFAYKRMTRDEGEGKKIEIDSPKADKHTFVRVCMCKFAFRCVALRCESFVPART